MFTGQYEHNIDDKGRLTIPVGYRDLLASGAYVSIGIENNLIIWSVETFTSLYHKLEEKKLNDATAREFGRFMFTNAFHVEMDKTGRILIPQYLRELAGLDGSVKLAGSGKYIEIWTIENFEKRQSKFMDADQRAEYFRDFDV